MATRSDHEDRPETDDDARKDSGQEAGGEEEAGDEEANNGDKVKIEGVKPAEAAKPVKTAKPARTGAGKRPARPAGRPPAAPPPRAQGGSLGKSMVLFLIIIGGLAAAFAFFGGETGGTGAAPKWKEGEKVAVEITLVAEDIKKLACWSPEELKGRHCAFEAPTKGWAKGDADDANLLRPYTTTDGAQFLAAGVWSQPALTSGKLPSSRFAIKCSYTVEGKLKRPGIRWSPEGAWLDRTDDWYAGLVSDCTLLNVAGK